MWLGIGILAGVAAVAAAVVAAFRDRAPPRRPIARLEPVTVPRPRPPAVPPRDASARIDAFWAWWPTASARLATTFDAGQGESAVEELSARVNALDPDLAWETGPARRGARHHLALSAEGDPALRVLVERWLARAPAPDGVWEFYPARQATPGDPRVLLTLHDAGGDVDLAYGDARVAWEADALRERLHVTYHHPALGKLPEDAQGRPVYLMLDGILGEDAVERWVGRIRWSVEPLADAQPLAALAEAVAALAREAKGERFAVAKGRDADGRPHLAVVNLALKRLDHLLMDHHLEIVTPFLDEAEDGMPTPEENEALGAIEDELLDALGHDAVYIGHETGGGRRTIHLHVSGFGPAEDRARAWARAHPDRELAIELRHDPGWDVLRRW